jgi:tRNA (cmo5U34)-methyltransferase
MNAALIGSVMKYTVEEIRTRFDNDVERFSNLETGQSAVVDSPLCMDLVASAAAAVTPGARSLLDIGCGAGNYTLKVLEKFAARAAAFPGVSGKVAIDCTLVDLSKPMLDRAVQRVSPQTAGTVTPLQGDMRELAFGEQTFDVIVAASTLHHLRTDAEWHAVFNKFFRALRPGGSLWIFDLIDHTHPAIETMMKDRYGSYLESLKGGGDAGRKYREHVFAYVAAEDTPKPLLYQIDLMRQVGFRDLDVLHKNVMGAAFGGKKP